MTHPPQRRTSSAEGLAPEIATTPAHRRYADASECASRTVRSRDSDQSEKMRWGNLLENVVADETARRLGVAITGRQVEVQHPDYPCDVIIDATYDEPAADDLADRGEDHG